MKNEKHYIDLSVNLIIKKLKWGEINDWSHGNFEELRRRILDSSQIDISEKTLKRLLGKEGKGQYSNPQLDTKNAIAKFLSYNDWFDFIEKNQSSELTSIKKKYTNKYLLISALSLVFIILVIILAINKNKFIKIKYEYSFTPLQVKGKAPFTFILAYDFSKVKADSIKIKYGFYSNTFKVLQKNKDTAYYTYNNAGTYKVRLYFDNILVDSAMVNCISDIWSTQITNNKDFYPVKSSINNGFLTINNSEVDLIGKLINQRDYWSRFTYINKIPNLSGNYFIFETTLNRDTSLISTDCNELNLKLHGNKNDKIHFHFANKGCQEKTDIFLPGIIIKGKENDLSSLCLENLNPVKIKLENINKNISLYINDVLKYKTSYTQSFDSITGFSLTFKGIGSIDKISIKNPKIDSANYKIDF